MNLCSHNHSEICFPELNCPFCEYVSEQESLLAQKDDEIKALTEQMMELTDENAKLKEYKP